MPIAGRTVQSAVPLHQILDRGLALNPDGLALVSAENRWTWRELDAAVNRLAGGWLRLGLRPGDRVASLMPNRCALLVHYLACMKAGLVGVPLNYRYCPPEIDHALAVSGASVILAHAERAEDLAAVSGVDRLPLGVVWYDAPENGQSFAELLTGPPPEQSLATPDPAAPAFVFFTSGSTGPAKGVTHTFGSIGWMLAANTGEFGPKPDDVILPGSSLSHLGGFLFSFAALCDGVRVVIARSFVADEVLPLLRRERPTILCMLPAALFGLVRDGHATREDFASLRMCRSGGDKVPLELEEELTALTGHPIDEVYGCTEAGHVAMTPPDMPIKIGSVGRPVPGFTLELRDDAGREVSVGTEGRLWLRSPSLMAGYWGDPTATAEVVRDGWLDTGDLMRADAEGYFWFCGRRKQIIIHDSSNICPQEVEAALLAHPAIAGAGVVGVRDLVHGENVRAYVALRAERPQPTTQELIEFARARIGYKAPEEVFFLPEMPMNPSGKLDRVALKRLAAARLGGEHSLDSASGVAEPA